MSVLDGHTLADALPRTSGWELGGYLYGLEPLALPPQWLRHTPLPDAAQLARVRAVLGNMAAAGNAPLPRPADADEIDRIFWFRWISGHQMTFAVWQILSAVVDEASRPAASTGERLEALAGEACLLVRAYSLLLLYTGSPPREIYSRVIRGPMSRQHAGVSGSWARDYAPLRFLFRDKVDFGPGRQAQALRHECALNQLVHEGVAAKLVPSGMSLLQSSNVNRGPSRLHRNTLLWLYDSIFLTTRAPVPYEVVVRQLVRRLHAAVLDLASQGLNPDFAPSGHEEPPILRTAEVLLRKEAITNTLLDLLAYVLEPRETAACLLARAR
ncbi:hypothetical protein [Micromonospora marina]|uniref:hypothetical protein n=1 Tax=Micromonospora marina TaxID=307120 RepID=UPI003D7152AE